jgi:hypothetical protein
VRSNRHIAWALILVITLPVLGLFAWLQAEKYAVRREVKHLLMEHIERDALVKLTFHEKEINDVLRWEHAGEFEYQHTMYDIVEQIHEGDSISYWCWEDNKESELNRALASLTDQWFGHTPDRKDQQEHVKRFMRQLFHARYATDLATHITLEKRMHKPHQSEVAWVELETPAPPPKA